MHKISFSQLQRAITTGVEPQTRSEAHEAEMALTIAEETALEEWCLVMYRWGFPIRLDMLKFMAVAVLEDRKRRNIESASDFFNRIMDPATRTQTLNAEGLGAPDISCIRSNWYIRFLSRHPALKPAYSRALDNDRAMNNNPKTITEYFNVLKRTMEEFKIKPQNIYNMDEKGFLIGVIKKSMRVLIVADENAAFLRQPGNRENITMIETVGIFNQNIPPMVILKGEKHLYGWYQGEMPAHWTTAVSPSSWTDAVLSCAWLQINFEPHTAKRVRPVEIVDSRWP